MVIFTAYLWALLGVPGMGFRDHLASFSSGPPLLLMPNFLPNTFVHVTIPYLFFSFLLGNIFQSLCLCSQSYPTLCNPKDCSLPGSSVHGISQTRIPGCIAISYSRESSRPRDQICVACGSCIGRQILYHLRHLRNPFQSYGWIYDNICTYNLSSTNNTMNNCVSITH